MIKCQKREEVVFGRRSFFLREVAVFHANMECVCLMVSLIEFHRKHANRRGRTLIALLHVSQFSGGQRFLLGLCQSTFSHGLNRPRPGEPARDLGERRPLCWILAPAVYDEFPERFALLRGSSRQFKEAMYSMIWSELKSWNGTLPVNVSQSTIA
jgi:hypothetical protein